MTTGHIVVTAGAVFAISSCSGDINPRTVEGFYAHDTRFLSTFLVSIQGHFPHSVGANQLDHSLASFYTSPHDLRRLPAAAISMVRDRYVSHGLHEDISIVNHSTKTRHLHLEIVFDADFADIFEVRLGTVRKAGQITVEPREGQHLCLVYRRGNFHRETWISFSRQPLIQGRTAIFDIILQPKETWKTCVTVLPVLDTLPPSMKCVETVLGPPFGAYHRQKRPSPSVLQGPERRHPIESPPRLLTDQANLQQVYNQAIADLRSLCIEYIHGHYILAAGFPWFMTVFGRDSIITAIQTKLLGPELLLGTLHTLASLQATGCDEFREAEPGKIPHEVRKGELSALKEVPHACYYGSVDATPLFLSLIWEAYQWTGDQELLRQFLPAIEAALQWIDRFGDIDGDGFVEYRQHTRHGLRNQGWKDSNDSISFSDGRLAQGPTALAEVQGYVYQAKRRMAMAYQMLGDSARAESLEQAALQLQQSFNQAFWMPEQDFYAAALDGRKQRVDSITSNIGQCLWSGIIDPERAQKVVQRLMAPDMFSGWGIRTLSTEMPRYSPLSYHNGSVWPHDNSLIAAGMARYGFTKEASEIAYAILEAATLFPDCRLPELFAGYPRREHSFPVPYPAANAPQAWACGTIIYLLETLLGVSPTGDRLLHEVIPGGPQLSLIGVPYRGTQRTL